MPEYQNIQTRMLGADSFPYRNVTVDRHVRASNSKELRCTLFIYCLFMLTNVIILPFYNDFAICKRLTVAHWWIGSLQMVPYIEHSIFHLYVSVRGPIHIPLIVLSRIVPNHLFMYPSKREKNYNMCHQWTMANTTKIKIKIVSQTTLKTVKMLMLMS